MSNDLKKLYTVVSNKLLNEAENLKKFDDEGINNLSENLGSILKGKFSHL